MMPISGSHGIQVNEMHSRFTLAESDGIGITVVACLVSLSPTVDSPFQNQTVLLFRFTA